jgi:antitoxin PrlF
MKIATISGKGQITLPKNVRDHLKVNSGDRVEFLIDSDGNVTVWPVTEDVTRLKGMIPGPKKPVSIKDMNQAILREGGKL